MIEFIKFILSDFWKWAALTIFAFLIFVYPVCFIAQAVTNAAIKKHEIDKCYEQLERDRQRGKENNNNE